MTFTLTYATPGGFDDLEMESDGEVLTGLGFAGSRDGSGSGGEAEDLPVFRETRRWLDIYFSGRDPGFTPRFRLVGATPFREAVSREMLKIPFGATVTYGDIATAIARERGLSKMSAQAVGQVVGWNPICIIIPCHRVVGAGGALTGYGGGMRNKVALLDLERNHFACRRCGACCRIPNGIVRVSDAEIARIAAFLGMAEAEFIERETEVAPDRKGLILKSRPDGACAWLTDDNLCRINPVKPDKCRTFPGEWRNPDSETVCPALMNTRMTRRLKKDDFVSALRFLPLREAPQFKAAAAAWFNAKWGVPEAAYLECMDAYLSGKTEYGWYLCLDGDQIAGGLGVIENDFHERKDLAPNICAVYVEESHRRRGIAGRLLDMAVEDLRRKGISPAYLLTDHTGFYERYGWEFLCLARGDGEERPSRMYVHR